MVASTQVAQGVHRLGSRLFNYYLVEDGEALTLVIRDSGHRQPLGHAAQVVGDPHELQTGERPLDRPFPGRQGPVDQIESE